MNPKFFTGPVASIPASSLIVAFHGPAGAGKTFLANKVLRSSHNNNRYILSFATPIKRIYNTLFNDYHERLKDIPQSNLMGDTQRTILQWIGSDVFRERDPEIWIRLLCAEIEPNCVVIIDDLRMPNELQWIKDNKGITVKIEVDGVSYDGHKGIPGHSSAKELPSEEFDIIFNNTVKAPTNLAKLLLLIDTRLLERRRK